MDVDTRDRLGEAREGIARHGTAVPRGQVAPGRDPLEGRFGRMFPCLPACEAGPDAIEKLAGLMALRRTTRLSQDNPFVPAGFTYLGQFIDHDITFDPTKLGGGDDPHALVNFRTPRLDLDSVYGGGPVVQPFLYDWKEAKEPGTRLLVGHNAVDATTDLPRNQQGRALIGDPRNDENVIVAQLHLLFIRFHNAVVDQLSRNGIEASTLLVEAQRIVRWHYQWIVVHEFLPLVAGSDTAEAVISNGAPGTAPTIDREHFKWRRRPFIPLEFSGAAYRFGHSMVRKEYFIKRPGLGARPVKIFPELAGFRWLPRSLVIDWERFFDISKGEVRSSQKIDTAIVGPLFHLPDGEPSLPRRNLLRGHDLALPSGQDVADAMDEPALEARELRLDDIDGRRAKGVLLRSTPLWYYILCEAEHRGGGPEPLPPGSHLGPVGGRIVAEVLAGLLEGDPTSYLSRKRPWEPQEEELGTDRSFSMAKLVGFVRQSAATSAQV